MLMWYAIIILAVANVVMIFSMNHLFKTLHAYRYLQEMRYTKIQHISDKILVMLNDRKADIVGSDE